MSLTGFYYSQRPLETREAVRAYLEELRDAEVREKIQRRNHN